jgi:hypothetical protein
MGRKSASGTTLLAVDRKRCQPGLGKCSMNFQGYSSVLAVLRCKCELKPHCVVRLRFHDSSMESVTVCAACIASLAWRGASLY